MRRPFAWAKPVWAATCKTIAILNFTNFRCSLIFGIFVGHYYGLPVNTLSDHSSIHRHRNISQTKLFVIACYRNFTAPKIYKTTVGGKSTWQYSSLVKTLDGTFAHTSSFTPLIFTTHCPVIWIDIAGWQAKMASIEFWIPQPRLRGPGASYSHARNSAFWEKGRWDHFPVSEAPNQGYRYQELFDSCHQLFSSWHMSTEIVGK